jgi:hypothetical protein
MISIPAPLAVTASAQVAAPVPPGVCTVILSNTGSTNVIYVGTSSAVTASGGGEGFPLPVNATVTFYGYPGSKGATLYAIAAGTGNNLGVIISTAG